MPAILATLVLHVRAEHVRTRVTALEWLRMLFRQRPRALLRHADSIWPALLDALGDEAEGVVFLGIEVIARLAAQDGYFAVALGRLMGRLAQSRELLEARAPLILRQLTALLEPRRVRRTAARAGVLRLVCAVCGACAASRHLWGCWHAFCWLLRPAALAPWQHPSRRALSFSTGPHTRHTHTRTHAQTHARNKYTSKQNPPKMHRSMSSSRR